MNINQYQVSKSVIEKKRTENLSYPIKRMTDAEKASLLADYHPDYREADKSRLRIGANRGESVPFELADLLEGKSRIGPSDYHLHAADIHADVLVIGGGGAGAAAAIESAQAGAKTVLVTKLRLGDSSTIMAEGGIQVATEKNDSLFLHFLDTFGGGHFSAKRELVKKMVLEGPEAVKWLLDLGVSLDRNEDGTMKTTFGGGTSRERMHTAKDCTGAEIMHTLQDEVLNRRITVIPYTSAIELLTDNHHRCCGAVLENTETGEKMTAVSKTVILATGGAGRLHYQGFPTSNHYGATADGLVIGYRAGAKLRDADTLQYHPTGAAYPHQISGSLVSEKVRALGAKLLNREGTPFVHPLETRDACAAAILRECNERNLGVQIGSATGVWLDTPMIDIIHGEGTTETELPTIFRHYQHFGIDIRKEPILVYPTLHYQNGGLEITADCMTTVENLYACGEVTGGIHGRNRLMGNALLDIIVFGRTAGKSAAEKALSITKEPEPTLDHLITFENERCSEGISGKTVSPVLLPDYRHHQ